MNDGIRLKFAASIIAGQSPESGNVDVLSDGLPFLQGNAEFGQESPDAQWQCESPPKIARHGDVLVSVRAPVGAVNIAQRDYGIGRGLCAVRPKNGSSRYFFWWLTSREDEMNAVATGSTFSAISGSDLGELCVPFTDPDRQERVVRYLDRETAEIDAFIADQEELIALLTERRAATISHAVTKGLDPTVPLKDSGVEWPLTVPTGWRGCAIRSVFQVLDCKHVTAEYMEEGGYPLASIREVKGSHVDLTNAKRTSRRFFEQLTEGGRAPSPGDLIVSRNASVGEVALVPDGLGEFAMGQDVSLIRDTAGLGRTRFLAYVLKSNLGVDAFARASVGSTFKRINVEDIKSVSFWLPDSPVEANAIADHLDHETAEIDAAIADAREAIALSRERRAALISAAVTGKIDVRDHAVTEREAVA